MPGAMKILMIHNTYQQRGGEDSVVDSETAMLRDAGCDVVEYRRHNDEIKQMSKLQAAAGSLWSPRSFGEVANLIAMHRPDIMHVHNTLPLVSPSVFWAASRAGLPSVMTLHNFRLLCPQAMFLRHEALCEDCLGHVPWRAITRRCYRESALQSSVQVAGITLHRGLGTFRHHVDRFIALSQFARGKFVQSGLPPEKVVVKPNFVEDGDGLSPLETKHRSGGLFVGRLSPEKGIDVLLDAMRILGQPVVEVVGHGPLEHKVRGDQGVVYRGSQPLSEVLKLMASKSFLVVPSVCYENFPRTIAEAFSKGLPVIASRLGGMAEIIDDGVTGLLFDVGNGADLADKIAWALANPDRMMTMGLAARAKYERCYTPAINAKLLTGLYAEVIDDRKRMKA